MANGFWQTVIRFDRAKIAPEIALRNTIGIVLPLLAGQMAGELSAGVVAALGAMNVSYSDSRDPYIVRTRRMLIASVMVGIAVSAGALSGHDSVSAVAIATLWAFAVGMLVVLGQRASDLGAVTLMTLLVFAARSLTVPEALWSGLLAFGGGLLQTVLAIAVWPVNPHEPERRIVSGLYSALAKVATTPAGSNNGPPASAAFTGAQEALASLSTDHSLEAERLVFLLSQAERIRLALLTMRRLVKRMERDPQCQSAAAGLCRILGEAASTLQTIADRVPLGKALEDLKGLNDTVREFRKHRWETSSAMSAALVRDAMWQIDALAGQLRAASGLAEIPQTDITNTLPQDHFSRIARLYANLSIESTAFRHAVRMAICVGVGDIVGRYFDIERSYWLPMTVAIVLKPDFTSTFSRGILRVGGTLVGLAAATGLFHLLPAGAGIDIALTACFALLLRSYGTANYGILVSAVSGIVVLLIAMTGVNPQSAIVARMLNTTAGGALALVTYWLWPTWEKTQAGPVLATMLECYGEYFRYIAGLHSQDRDMRKADALRVAARLARSNAEASVGRFSAEPRVDPGRAALLSQTLVSSHAFVRAAMAIESALYAGKPAPMTPEARDFVNDVEITLAALCDALRAGSQPPANLPDLREAWNALQQQGPSTALFYHESDRIVVSLNTLREQVQKWNSGHRAPALAAVPAQASS